jgi:hypothetical protein
MYDAGKIISGLVIFGILLASPLWFSVATGGMNKVPEPRLPTSENHCVESAQWMRDNHMHLLEEWRQMAVRDGIHTYVASDGKEYEISLTDTCLSCHSNKAEFCDQCHSYAGVSPNCWDCHVAPEGK